MTTVVRFLQFFTLGTWIGAALYFGAIVAPAAFSVLTADQAGALVGLTLGRLHLMGIVAGVIYLLVTAIWARSAAALLRPAPLLVLVMVVLTFISQFWVSGTMDALRVQIGSVSATPASNQAQVGTATIKLKQCNHRTAGDRRSPAHCFQSQMPPDLHGQV